MEIYWGKNGTRTRVIENILKPDGNRISAQVDYEYDNLYRLVHEHRIAYNGGDAGVAYEYNFKYDAAGNRTQWEIVGGNTTNYTYDGSGANKLVSKTVGGVTTNYSYNDPNHNNIDRGNITSEVTGNITTTYTWDLLNRMTQWAKTDQTTQTYLYNADGNRVRVTPSGGTARNFVIDGIEIVEEIVGNDVKSYIGPGLICQISDTSRTIYHADAIGSTRAITNENQTVQEAVIYDAYGNEQVGYTSVSNFAYAGQYRYYADSTGLDYLKARYYDSGAGRFLSRDPLPYTRDNLYGYVLCNPVSGVDPKGLFCVKAGPCSVTQWGSPQLVTIVPLIVWGKWSPPTGIPVSFSYIKRYKRTGYGRALFHCFGFRWDMCNTGQNGIPQLSFDWYQEMGCSDTEYWHERVDVL